MGITEFSLKKGRPIAVVTERPPKRNRKRERTTASSDTAGKADPVTDLTLLERGHSQHHVTKKKKDKRKPAPFIISSRAEQFVIRLNTSPLASQALVLKQDQGQDLPQEALLTAFPSFLSQRMAGTGRQRVAYKDQEIMQMILEHGSADLRDMPIQHPRLMRLFDDLRAFTARTLHSEFHLANPKDLQIFPIPEKQPFAINIAGARGSGKSTFAANWLIETRRLWPNCPIYVISPVDDDPVYKTQLDPEPMFVKIHPGLLTDEPLNVEGFALPVDEKTGKHPPVIIVFDDVEALDAPSGMLAHVSTFRDTCLLTGRHHGICVINISHVLLGGWDTKIIHTECRYTALYHGSNFGEIKSFLQHKMGIDTSSIQRLKRTSASSQWILLSREFPMYAVTETEIILI